MRTSLVVVSATLTLAIVLLAGFLIATQAHGRSAVEVPLPHDHLWKMKNAPAAINAKPMA